MNVPWQFVTDKELQMSVTRIQSKSVLRETKLKSLESDVTSQIKMQEKEYIDEILGRKRRHHLGSFSNPKVDEVINSLMNDIRQPPV
jgi:hypothetical protein